MEKPDAYALKCLEGIFANTNQDRGNIKDPKVSLCLFSAVDTNERKQ